MDGRDSDRLVCAWELSKTPDDLICSTNRNNELHMKHDKSIHIFSLLGRG